LNARKLHRIAGLILLLPFIGWIVTGTVFLVKPGYDQAYQQLSAKRYPLEQSFSINPQPEWKEIKLLQSILGPHLLVNGPQGWQQLDPVSLQPVAKPDDAQLIRLLEDALPEGNTRYGTIETVRDDTFITTTGVELSLHWDSLSISQQGADTKFLSTLYKIHYLQWLGNKQANLLMGITGLFSLAVLVYFGMVVYIRARAARSIRN